MGTPDPATYRRVINWERRLKREGAHLLRHLRIDDQSRVLDLGCGTGEHLKFLVDNGARAGVGVDRSREMIAAAHASFGDDPRLRYVEAPMEDLPDEIEGPFTSAMCVGNSLVHLTDEESLSRCIAGVARRLAPGAPFWIQILNYEAITTERRRACPVALEARGEGTEVAFVRFMDHEEPGYVDFESAVLERHKDGTTTLLSTQRSRLRAWARADLVPALRSEIGKVKSLGTIEGKRFNKFTSSDLILLAEKRSA